jgi:hypothetical protein
MKKLKISLGEGEMLAITVAYKMGRSDHEKGLCSKDSEIVIRVIEKLQGDDDYD